MLIMYRTDRAHTPSSAVHIWSQLEWIRHIMFKKRRNSWHTTYTCIPLADIIRHVVQQDPAALRTGIRDSGRTSCRQPRYHVIRCLIRHVCAGVDSVHRDRTTGVGHWNDMINIRHKCALTVCFYCAGILASWHRSSDSTRACQQLCMWIPPPECLT